MSLRRRIEIIEQALFGKSDTFWHETGVFEDGTHWGTLGAMTYIIDPETRRAMSKGYHKIIPRGCGHYEFQTGATRGEFTLRRIG